MRFHTKDVQKYTFLKDAEQEISNNNIDFQDTYTVKEFNRIYHKFLTIQEMYKKVL